MFKRRAPKPSGSQPPGWSPLLEFGAATAAWAAAKGASSTAAAEPGAPSAVASEPLVVLTHNVWFSKTHKRARFAALVDLVAAERPAAALLQEMTPAAAAWLLEDPRIRSQYLATDPDVITATNWYGLLTLVRKDLGGAGAGRWRYTSYRSPHGRGLLEVDCGGVLRVGNTHLESPTPGTTAAHRAVQLGMARGLMAQPCGGDGRAAVAAAVLGGDFNYVSSAEDAALAANGLADAWRTVHGDASSDGGDGLTFDGKANPNCDGPWQSRPDRIVSAGPGIGAATAVRMLGKEAVAGIGCPPSDHYGLVATFAPAGGGPS